MQTEYKISVVKHLFPRHIVLQFDCRNTLNDQLLENVSVAVETDTNEIRQVYSSTIATLANDEPQTCFVAFQKAEGSCPIGTRRLLCL